MRAGTRVVSLLLAALLAGCFGGDEAPSPWAQPTDTPKFPPVRSPSPVYTNFSDPGYPMKRAWQVGDGWDYVSNRSNFSYVRVMDVRTSGETVWYRVEEFGGRTGNLWMTRTSSWIDGTNWTRHNQTDLIGGHFTTFDPPQPLRTVRNSTYAYNTTSVLRSTGQVTTQLSTYGNSFLYNPERIKTSWGTHDGARVDHYVVVIDLLKRTDQGAFEERRSLRQEYLLDAYGNLARFVDGVEAWRLVAYRSGEAAQGVLAPTD